MTKHIRTFLFIVVLLVVVGTIAAYMNITHPGLIGGKVAATTTYMNASADLIQVTLPLPGAVTGKQFKVMGKARGSWYFEASFPVQILDKNGNTLAAVSAQTKSDWMTEDFVPFEVDISVPDSYIGSATVVLKNDNPSGMPERNRSASFPITIEY